MKRGIHRQDKATYRVDEAKLVWMFFRWPSSAMPLRSMLELRVGVR